MILPAANFSCKKWYLAFLCLLLYVTGYSQSLQAVHERYRPLIRGAKEDTFLIRQLLKYGSDLMDFNNDTALVVLERAAKLSQAKNDTYGRGKSATLIGIVYADKADFPTSKSYYDQAAIHFSALGNYLELGKVFNNTGNLYYFQDRYDEAIIWYLKAVDVFEKAGAHHLMAQVNDGIGNTFQELGQHEKSLHYLRKAEAIARQNKDTLTLARALSNLSVTYSSMNKRKESLLLALEALKMADHTNDQVLPFMIRSNIADTYIDYKQFDSAASYLREAERLALKAGTPYYLLQVYLCYSKIYENTKEYLKAKDYLFKSVEIAERIGSKEGLFKAYGKLLQVYSALGMHEQSMGAFKKFVLYNDSLANEKMANRVNDLETKYRTLQKDKELSDKQLAIEHQRSALKKKDMFIVFSIISMITLLIIGVLIWLGFRQKQKLQWLMIRKEHELLAVKAMMEGEERERTRIARNLHDGVGSILSAARLNMDSLGRQVGQLPAIPAYHESLTLLKDATSEIRETAHNLLPVILHEQGLYDAVQAFCLKFSNNHQLGIDFQSYGTPVRFNHHFELMIYRTIQELINNVVRHAEASRALVQLVFNTDMITITVEDNGKGFDPSGIGQLGGLGINSLHARMKAFQGKVDIDSSPRGTSIHIEFKTDPLLYVA